MKSAQLMEVTLETIYHELQTTRVQTEKNSTAINGIYRELEKHDRTTEMIRAELKALRIQAEKNHQEAKEDTAALRQEMLEMQAKISQLMLRTFIGFTLVTVSLVSLFTAVVAGAIPVPF